MSRLASAFLLLVTGLFVTGPVLLPVSLVGCCVVSLVFRVKFIGTILRFLGLWIFFYLLVGFGRHFAGTELRVLISDGASSLGLALEVSCAVLLVMTALPAEMLHALDKLRVPREFTYALLSVTRLLPEMRAVGSRQLSLLRLKALVGKGLSGRFRAYRRIVSPLLVVLLERQSTHARSLEMRGFFERPSHSPEEVSTFGSAGVAAVTLLLANVVLWFMVKKWLT